jgi:RNA polymerase sigma-70 factor (ECF subfamily)
MADPRHLLDRLRRTLEPDAREVLSGTLGDGLAARIGAAPGAWPGVEVPVDDFVDYLTRHLPRDPLARQAWESWTVDELYLCCACVRGDPEALRQFEARFLPVIHGALRRNRLPEALREELAQDLRERLFVGRDGAEPLLERYGGLGSLGGWLGVVTARAARQSLQREKRYVLVGDDRIVDVLSAPPGHPTGLPLMRDADPLKAAYRGPFRQAVRTALEGLEPRDLTLIRMRYVDGLTLKRIAATYRVHLATVHRWIDAIQNRLLERTRALMMEALEIDAEECASVFRMMQSHLDLTITTLLGRPEKKETS